MRKKTLTREDLFCEPNFDELRDIAVDPSTGLQRLLSHEQLESVREEGEFEVDSREFPNQVLPNNSFFFFLFGKNKSLFVCRVNKWPLIMEAFAHFRRSFQKFYFES